MDFFRAFVTSATWDTDELIYFWGQKVKGHSSNRLVVVVTFSKQIVYLCLFVRLSVCDSKSYGAVFVCTVVLTYLHIQTVKCEFFISQL